MKADDVKVIGYEIDFKNLNHYILLEKLLPISAIIKVNKSEEIIELANKLINNLGKGHFVVFFQKKKFYFFCCKKYRCSQSNC